MTTDKLSTLIDAKLALLQKLRQLAALQLSLIDQGEIAQIVRVAAGKQQLVSEMQSLDRELAPYSQQDPQSRVWTSDAARVRCRDQAQRCSHVLTEILELDAQSETAMLRRRADIENQLINLQPVAQAQRAYVSAGTSSGLLDLTSEG